LPGTPRQTSIVASLAGQPGPVGELDCEPSARLTAPVPSMPQFASDRFGRVKGLPSTAPGQRVGLLGGSFNPPHIAHRQISEIVLKRLGLDQIWWLVTPGNPLKGRGDLAPLAERLLLCRAMAKNPRIEVTAFERDLPAAFTAGTLAFLKRRSPRVRFVWIMGADNLVGFHHWRRWREILTTVPVVVVDRPGWRLKALASKAARAFAAHRVPEARAKGLVAMPPPAWTFLTGPLSSVSSTDLRRKARRQGHLVAQKPQVSEPAAATGAGVRKGLRTPEARESDDRVPETPQADRPAAPPPSRSAKGPARRRQSGKPQAS
jgi:nicotinate-nucleotide adenylyltransferase